MADYLDAVEIETGPDPESAIIWLHGLGADGHDFEPVVPQMQVARPTRFVFPHAPPRAVTINNGATMRAWYDIYSFDRDGPVDETGIRASTRQVEALIEREIERGCSPGNIVVAGFSQGGAIALHAGLRHANRLAGLMALSCYIPLYDSLAAEAAPVNQDTPIFMAHGSFDPVLPAQLGEAARDRLTAAGYQVEWHSYQMAHGVCPQEIVDIAAWLAKLQETET